MPRIDPAGNLRHPSRNQIPNRLRKLQNQTLSNFLPANNPAFGHLIPNARKSNTTSHLSKPFRYALITATRLLYSLFRVPKPWKHTPKPVLTSSVANSFPYKSAIVIGNVGIPLSSTTIAVLLASFPSLSATTDKFSVSNLKRGLLPPSANRVHRRYPGKRKLAANDLLLSPITSFALDLKYRKSLSPLESCKLPLLQPKAGKVVTTTRKRQIPFNAFQRKPSHTFLLAKIVHC